MILSYGSPEAEVESYLGLPFALSGENPQVQRVLTIVRSAEAFVSLKTERRFEHARYVDYLSPSPGRQILLLAERPVSQFVTLERVSDSRVGTVDPAAYVVDPERGLVIARDGFRFSSGPRSHRATYDAGYADEQIQSSASPEIALLKELLLSLVAQQYGLAKDQNRHLTSVSFADSTTAFKYTLDDWQQDALRLLHRRQRRLPGEIRLVRG